MGKWLDGLFPIGTKNNTFVDQETGLTLVLDSGGERYMPSFIIGDGLGIVRVGFTFDGRARLSITDDSTTDMDNALRISEAIKLGATRAKMWQDEFRTQKGGE